MPVNYAFKPGVDLPSWHWLSPFPGGQSFPGTSNTWDGVRYMYWAVQYGSTSVAGTSQLWRYDTYTNGWQFLTALTSGFAGIDIEYDGFRNVLWILEGNGTTAWRYFNLNTANTTILGVLTSAFTLSAALTPVLPTAASVGASLALTTDTDVPATVDSGVAGTGSTTTSLVTTNTSLAVGMIGMQVRMTSGTAGNIGVRRIISAVPSANTLTLSVALPNAPAAADGFVIELPTGTAASGSTTTLVTTGGLAVNQYRDSDVLITAGTGVGQRRRIASNDATTLTLAASTTGNARTGAFATAVDATSVYQILPSADYLYYVVANSTTTFSRIDLGATTGVWSAQTVVPAAPAGGANLMHPQAYAPFCLILLRGAGTQNYYVYQLGLATWLSPNVFGGQETFTTGTSSAMVHGKRKMFIQKDGASRCYFLDLVTNVLEPAGYLPYASPINYEGHRARYVITASGVTWLYLLRGGGQEFYRVPVEWV